MGIYWYIMGIYGYIWVNLLESFGMFERQISLDLLEDMYPPCWHGQKLTQWFWSYLASFSAIFVGIWTIPKIRSVHLWTPKICRELNQEESLNFCRAISTLTAGHFATACFKLTFRPRIEMKCPALWLLVLSMWWRDPFQNKTSRQPKTKMMLETWNDS